MYRGAQGSVLREVSVGAHLPERLVTLIVMNVSTVVGWMPTVLSKSSLVAPHRMATAKPCVISPALGPHTCRPTTREASAVWQMSFA